MHSGEDLTDSFWGPARPNIIAGNTDDCAVFVISNNRFTYEDRNCSATKGTNQTVAPICQYDSVVTTTTGNPVTVTTTLATDPTVTVTTTNSASTTTQPVCPSGWTRFQENCYHHFLNKTNWTDAERNCRESNASLVSIHSIYEKHFLSTFVVNKSHWVGALHFGSEDFIWTDNSNTEYKDFYDTRPGYLYQYNTYGWCGCDLVCQASDFVLGYVCKKLNV